MVIEDLEGVKDLAQQERWMVLTRNAELSGPLKDRILFRP
jgi:hypothetical protein